MKSFFIFSFLILSVSVAVAQAGKLDASFGNNGIVTAINYIGNCTDLVIQDTQKILVIGTGSFGDAGGFLLVRYNSDGSPDLSFGDSGRVATEISARGSYGAYASIQADGKIVMTGVIPQQGDGNNLVLIRYNVNGAVDSSFGTNGTIINNLGKYENPSGIFIQPDGKIVVGGTTTDPREGGALNTIYLVRYNTDGTPDESFGSNGVFQQTITDPIQTGGVILTPDNKILVGGNYKYSKQNAFFVRRYLQNGNPDLEFALNGETIFGFTNETVGSILNSLSLTKDGKIICAGSTFVTTIKSNATLVRFNSDGSIDNNFGNEGLVTTEYNTDGSDITEIALQNNGNIAAAGNIRDASTGAGLGFAIFSYLSSGNLDSSFALNGIDTTIIGFSPYAQSMALQEDGKIIIGGYTLTPPAPYTSHVVLARYNGDNPEKYVHIKHWLHKHGITWEDKPGNLVNYYAVERSTNGNSFTEIARIFNHNNQTQYSYEDNNATSSTTYYRLRTVSTDGAVAYSNIISLDNNETAIKIYPNPAQNNLEIDGLSATAKTKLTVVDFSGNIKTAIIVNSSSYNLNISPLKQGNYLLRIETNNSVVTKKFVKD